MFGALICELCKLGCHGAGANLLFEFWNIGTIVMDIFMLSWNLSGHGANCLFFSS